jgi:tetratricopeptide (TPR) repeat protein
MLEKQDAAEEHLRHPDPMVRMTAVSIVFNYWGAKPGDEATRVCEEIAIHDTDFNPRSAALSALGECYLNTDDIRIGRLLANVARDEGEVEICRLSACEALHSLRGLSQPLWPGARAVPPTMPRVPEDIDWSFVDSFLIEGRNPSPKPVGTDAILAELGDPDRTAFRFFDEGCEAYERSDYARSVELFTRSINAIPFGGVYIARGGAYLKAGEFDKAIGDFSKAIELNPRRIVAYRSRAVAYGLKGFTDLANADNRTADELEFLV